MKVPMPMATDVAYGRQWRVERIFSGPDAAEAARQRDIMPPAARQTVADLDPRCGDCTHLTRNDGPCPGGAATADLPDRQAGSGHPLCHDFFDDRRERLTRLGGQVAQEDAA